MDSLRSPFHNITSTVVGNLQDQHDWTSVHIHNEKGPRPLIRGLPPRRLYMHPDDQIAALASEQVTGIPLSQTPKPEWVLAVHLEEKWSLTRFAAIFDSICHSGGPRGKRIVLATVHNDSTVVYYVMHEGMVKPRQN